MAQVARRMLSAKAEQFTESVIREMTRLAMKHGAVNLSQGFPDFAAPAEIKEAARQAISDDINQYAITWGAKPLRDAIVEKFERTQGIRVDPEREITICCGSTEAMMSAMMAIITSEVGWTRKPRPCSANALWKDSSAVGPSTRPMMKHGRGQ